MNEQQTPRFDFLILADRAEAINGKLYLMGGGWDTILVNPDDTAAFSIAAAIMVPWGATNHDHMLALSLQDADGTDLLRIQTGFRTGRPPAIAEGAEQRVMLALPVAIKFPQPGRYAIVGTVGEDTERVTLYANARPQIPFIAPPPTQ